MEKVGRWRKQLGYNRSSIKIQGKSTELWKDSAKGGLKKFWAALKLHKMG